MRGRRTERMARILSRLLLRPSKLLSLTETAADFDVSKTLVSDDVEILSEAIESEGIGSIVTDRGRAGGSYFFPAPSKQRARTKLLELAELLSVKERMLVGGLIYYSDLIFDPEWASFIGFMLASFFEDAQPTAVMTTEVKGISIGMFCAQALGVPLAVCRFRNRPSDGSAVGVHFQNSSGDLRTMYMSTRMIDRSSRVLIVDDFMRGGSTVNGMKLIVREFGAETAGIGVFISEAGHKKSAPAGLRSLLDLYVRDGIPCLELSSDISDDSQ